MSIQPFIYGHSGAFSTREKKMKSGYDFLSHTDYQNVRSSNFFASPKCYSPTPYCY